MERRPITASKNAEEADIIGAGVSVVVVAVAGWEAWVEEGREEAWEAVRVCLKVERRRGSDEMEERRALYAEDMFGEGGGGRWVIGASLYGPG